MGNILLKFQGIIFNCCLEKNYFRKNFRFSLSDENTSKKYPIVPNFGTEIAFYIFEPRSLPKKSGSFLMNIFEIKNFFLKFLNCVFSENCRFIELQFYPLITLVVCNILLKSQVIIFICCLEKNYFRKYFRFSLSDRNTSKNYPIVSNFGTEIAFLYRRAEFVAQEKRFISNEYI